MMSQISSNVRVTAAIKVLLETDDSNILSTVKGNSDSDYKFHFDFKFQTS